MALDGYRVGKRLRASARAQVHLAVRESDGVEVELKTYAAAAGLEPRARAELELEALRRAANPGIPRAFEVVEGEAGPVLVLEHLAGSALAERIEAGALGLEEWLDLAIQLCDTLVQIHAAGVLHRALAPHHIVLDAAGGRAWLTEFGRARLLGTAYSEIAEHAGPKLLPYISPEQTGRMNRGCDFRSDLYALGATLYAAACGRPPFDSEDRLELTHAHMALVPVPPTQLRSELPEPVSRLILKLLRKEPDERYQSARALHAELCALRAQLAQGGRSALDAAAREAPERPQLPARLGVREREAQVLRDAWEQAVHGGRFVLVCGEPGAGKSALVEQLRPHVSRSQGYFAVGKFELDRGRAYAGWAALLASFAQQILLESDERLAHWRRTLCEGLGTIASVLVELSPDLGFVIGDVPPVPALPPGETQARLCLALQRFVAVAATPSHPLVLFFDDLHWSETESRVLLEEVLARSGPAALLAVAAARVDGSDTALASLVARLRSRIPVVEIELAPLPIEATAELLAAGLERTPDVVRPLAERLASALGSTPLLVRQFIEYIHQRGWLRYEHGTGWAWSAQVESEPLPDGPIALMTAKLDGLDPGLQSVLRLASCAGDEFDAPLLAELSGQPLATLERALVALTLEGLIAPSASGDLRFAHDRIREASQALLSPQERARTHAQMTGLLLERCSAAELAERAFEIADHLNRGRAYLPDELRPRAVELNLEAGKRALAAGAPVMAASYLTAGMASFREEDWIAHPARAFELHLLRASSAFQCGELERTLELTSALERRASGALERALVTALHIQILALTRPPEEGMRYALDELRRLGVRWPLHPSYARTWLALRAMQWRLGAKGEPRLERARSFDPGSLAQILIIGAASGLMSRTDHYLSALASCHVLRTNLRRGYLVTAGYALAGFALHAQLLLGDAALARRHAQNALAWCDRMPDPSYDPRVQLTVHVSLGPCLRARREALAAGLPIAELARESGDREFEHYVRFLNLYYLALAGDPVPETERALGVLAEDIRRTRNAYASPERCQRIYGLLRRPTRDIKAELAASDRWLAEHPSGGDSFIRTLWLLVLCVHRRFEQAFAQSEALGAALHRLSPFAHVADHCLYRGLAAAELATHAGLRARWRYSRALRECRRRLRRWSRGGPDFAHMACLLEAEQARLRGRPAAAVELYAQAAAGADRQRFGHHAAIAHERRAQLLAELGAGAAAGAALHEAGARYRAWGAVGPRSVDAR